VAVSVERHDPKRAGVRPRWILPFLVVAAPVLATALVVAALAGSISAGPVPTAAAPVVITRTLAPLPAASPTPTAPAAAPPDVPIPEALVQPPGVEDVVLPAMAEHLGTRDNTTLVSQVTLGEEYGVVAWGTLLGDGQVCLNYSLRAIPDEGRGQCDSYAVFDRYGFTADGGSWSLHWSVDGTVTWEGSS